VIPEPQRTYVLELLHALGPAANEFVVAGAQAMKFMVGPNVARYEPQTRQRLRSKTEQGKWPSSKKPYSPRVYPTNHEKRSRKEIWAVFRLGVEDNLCPRPVKH